MLPPELVMMAEATIASIPPGSCETWLLIPLDFKLPNLISAVSDETIQRLRCLFPDTLILAALDLIDRDSGELISCYSISLRIAKLHVPHRYFFYLVH